MNNYIQVDHYLQELKARGDLSKSAIIWELALACVEWPYVFGAAGALCTPKNRKERASAAHPTIVSSCQVLNGKRDSCSGCKWLPDGVNVRQYDCRGFTRWCAAQVGITIRGAGATSQWDDDRNWSQKGQIANMPKDQLVCLFVRKDTKMDHTGWGYNQETIECSNGVQHFTKRNKKWTHWAVPKGLEGGVIPLPEFKPTIKRGSKGQDVTELQQDLLILGYSLPKYGADGDFGRETEAALKQFQTDSGLTPDGVCGPLTWEAIREIMGSDPSNYFTVTIPHLSEKDAMQLLALYPAGSMKKEAGENA